MKKEEQKPNKPQKPQLNIAVVSGSFYWVNHLITANLNQQKQELIIEMKYVLLLRMEVQ